MKIGCDKNSNASSLLIKMTMPRTQNEDCKIVANENLCYTTSAIRFGCLREAYKYHKLKRCT